MELCLLSHVDCFCVPVLCSLLISHVFASIYFWLSFLFLYLDNHVCYLVLQFLDQLEVALFTQSLIPPSSVPSESHLPAQLFLSEPLPSLSTAVSSTLKILTLSSRFQHLDFLSLVLDLHFLVWNSIPSTWHSVLTLTQLGTTGPAVIYKQNNRRNEDYSWRHCNRPCKCQANSNPPQVKDTQSLHKIHHQTNNPPALLGDLENSQTNDTKAQNCFTSTCRIKHSQALGSRNHNSHQSPARLNQPTQLSNCSQQRGIN